MNGDWVALGLGGLAAAVYLLFLAWEKHSRRKQQLLLQQRYGKREEST